ncbi:hypothetical protein KAF25_000359 [Fusarium avenaceum]|uniref:Antifungal protein n=1 Tax=Fusarium avenaceum TaxID=40199 RepID=A0A9P7H6D4_9HYPO|nr:hypothetical protein KAF25_000359 [Fusarium avenaceum]
MQFSTITLFLAATMGVVATPVDSPAQELDARGNLFPRLDYHGTCTKSTNRCRYINDKKRTVIISCPKFANKKCTKDGNKCTYDSAARSVICH